MPDAHAASREAPAVAHADGVEQDLGDSPLVVAVDRDDGLEHDLVVESGGVQQDSEVGVGRLAGVAERGGQQTAVLLEHVRRHRLLDVAPEEVGEAIEDRLSLSGQACFIRAGQPGGELSWIIVSISGSNHVPAWRRRQKLGSGRRP
jgi:hypothetical protein